MALLKSRAEKSVDEILAGIERTTNQLLTAHREGFRRVWNDPVLTPDEVVAQMGPRGTGIMGTAWGLVQLLLQIDPNIMSPDQYLPRRGLIFHDDGSVTLAPPPDGYDAWGRPIVKSEDPPNEPISP